MSVKIIIETEKDSHGRLKADGLNEILGSGIQIADVYVWPESERPSSDKGYTGVLHAKCSVADSRVALISSANLTEAAMDLNMEMGIVIRGSEVPSIIHDHFNSLISKGVISRVGH
ncbi:Phospholipase D/Transphosphatidylase (fragment) [Candidatus Zixiibacteriota bacterium]